MFVNCSTGGLDQNVCNFSTGGLDYVFDGGTAVRYPVDQLQPHWYQEYTISGWIKPRRHTDRQYIFSWSSGDSPKQQNTGLFVTR